MLELTYYTNDNDVATKLIQQWTRKHNGSEKKSNILQPTREDGAFAQGHITAYGDVMDYLEEKDKRATRVHVLCQVEKTPAALTEMKAIKMIYGWIDGPQAVQAAIQTLKQGGYQFDENEFINYYTKQNTFINDQIAADPGW